MGKGEGKGEGRGSCGVLEDIGECVQCIASCVCLLLILGPLLIILGLVFISSAFTNDRQARIDEFNVSVENWTNDILPQWEAAGANDWQYSVNNTCGGSSPLAVLSSFSDPEDLGAEAEERDTFAAYTPLSYVDDAPPDAGQLDSNCTLNFGIFYKNGLVGEFSEPAVSTRQVGFNNLRCSRTTSTRRNSSGQTQSIPNESEDVRDCRSTCTSRGGRPSGNSYASFQCALPVKPTSVCLRVEPSGNSFKIATGTLPDRPEGARGSGCFRPLVFGGGSSWETTETDFVEQGNTLQVDMQIRHEGDPYLYFLDISQGTKNFGLTTGEKLQIGFTLLAIGILIQSLVCLCCCCIVKFARSFASGKADKRPENPVGGAMYDVAGKYGNYIPGGAALGHPAPGQTMQGVPTAGVNQAPPQGYPSSGSPVGYGQPYDGNTSYDSPQKPSSPATYPYGGAPAGGAPQGYPTTI